MGVYRATVQPQQARPWFAPFAGIAYQYAYPVSDVAANGWQSSLGGALYAAIDETMPDGSDYIYSPDNPTTQEFEVMLGPLVDPGVDGDFTLSYLLRAIGLDTTFTMSLYDGATQIKQWTESVAVADGEVLLNHTLTSAEAANISNFSDLRLRGVASA